MDEGYIKSFKLKVYESNGIEYESLFSKVMSYYQPNFDKVKSHGNIGDRGNDGWVSGKGIYYQVYAPEDLPSNEKKSLDKMKSDFMKLYSYWNTISPVREFYFVVNDKYNGIPPHLNREIAEIKKKHKLRKAMVIGAIALENYFSTLSSEQKYYICGKGGHQKYPTERHLVELIRMNMFLFAWRGISDNIFAHAIQFNVIEGFYDTIKLLRTTEMPGRLPELDSSMLDLANRVEEFCEHMTDENFTYAAHGFWQQDMRWKRIRIAPNEYDEKYASVIHWRRELFRLHYNLCHALNLFATQVRRSLDPDFMRGAIFVMDDELGVHNNMTQIVITPDSYATDYKDLLNI